MEEVIITGYCRMLDAARTVLYDTEEQCADCCYPNCVHRTECPIAQKIESL